MKTLYLHTDTTASTPWNWKLPSMDRLQPHMVYVALLFDDSERFVPTPPQTLIIEPLGRWIYESGAIERHHITPDYALENGKPLRDVMFLIDGLVSQADRLVGYAADFHRHVLERSAADLGNVWLETKPLWFDAMKAATPICRVPRQSPGGGYSFPKMAVAYQHFSGKELRLSADPIEAGLQMVLALQTIDRGIAEVLKPDKATQQGGSL